MGHTLWLSIPSCQWSQNGLWFNMMSASPTYNKTYKYIIKCDSHYVWCIMGPRALYWQFCLDLVLSKLTVYRHYRPLQTMRWSHRQSKLILLTVEQKVYDQLDTFVDKQLLPVEERRELFKELSCCKINIWLMHPWSKCSCLIQWYGKNMFLVVPLFW